MWLAHEMGLLDVLHGMGATTPGPVADTAA